MSGITFFFRLSFLLTFDNQLVPGSDDPGGVKMGESDFQTSILTLSDYTPIEVVILIEKDIRERDPA